MRSRRARPFTGAPMPMTPLTSPPHDRGTRKLACSRCGLREICLPMGLSGAELRRVDSDLVAHRSKVARGDFLFRQGDPVEAVYAVWTGFFRTRARSADRREQVTGFQMGGELIGLEAIGSSGFLADAVALENSQVCVIRFEALQALAREVPTLQQQVHRTMGREIARRQHLMLLLGGTQPDQRVAAFLLDLTQRMKARGYSASSLHLRMTRRDIGSLLGLTLETVSRSLSRLQAASLLVVRTRQIQITDATRLAHLVERPPAEPARAATPRSARSRNIKT